ncbi:isoprenylcysteine carboxylmethyltransferase family protein [Castellaniella sp. FW104-16D08]|uniref:methyltransferase family protein n=1 Tax=unclassified Castellaniella TaxID=2617606 RepID=UPI0033145D77
MKRLELLIPPPLVMLLVGLIMWLLAQIFPSLAAAWLSDTLMAIVLAFLGLVIALAGVATFKRARTTIDPKRPTDASALVSSGIYRFSRNPMYLGVLLVLAGWAVYLGNLLSVLGLLVFVAYITRFQIIPEERLLHEKFGAAFLAYKDKVRRWI